RSKKYRAMARELDDTCRWVTRTLWALPNYATLFLYHLDGGAELQDWESYDEQLLKTVFAAFTSRLIWFDPSEITVEDGDTQEEQDGKLWLRNEFSKRLDNIASSARSNDISNLKDAIATYIIKSLPQEDELSPHLANALADLRLPMPLGDKTLRGFKCRATARALIPPEDQPLWDEDPDLMMKNICVRKHGLSPKHMPSFAYKDYVIDPTDAFMGLFKNNVIVKVLKHLYRGPEAARSDKPPKQAPSANQHDTTVTEEKVAYALLMTRHALSSDKDWRTNEDGVSKTVFWRYCLQILHPDLTMDLGVDDYDDYTDDEADDNLDQTVQQSIIGAKKGWVKGVLSDLSESVYGPRPSREKRTCTQRSSALSTAAQMSRNLAMKIALAQAQRAESETSPHTNQPDIGSREPSP
ncbi:hypothetical protein HDZ31DRAFT_15457, partial [Schizophyllum fasciatum]